MVLGFWSPGPQKALCDISDGDGRIAGKQADKPAERANQDLYSVNHLHAAGQRPPEAKSEAT